MNPIEKLNEMYNKQDISNGVIDLIDSDYKLKYDREAKILFSYKEVLSVIAKYTVTELKDYTFDEIAKMIGNVDISKKEVSPNGIINKLDSESSHLNEKKIFYDIKTTINGEIDLILNLEIQNKDKPGYSIDKRALYYGARLISEQLLAIKEFSDYDSIKKVYSIWLITNSKEESIKSYQMKEVETNEINEDIDKIQLVLIRFNSRSNINVLVNYLNALFNKDMEYLKSNYYNITNDVERSLNNMCNLSEGIEERGIEKGIEKGVKKGRLEGIEEGKLESIYKLSNKGFNIEEACSLLDVKVEDYLEYIKKKDI